MRRIFPLLLVVLLLTGCGSAGMQDVSPFAPAQSERLVIFTSHKEKVYRPVIEEFEYRTGVWVEIETGGTATLLERIAAGESGCDLMFGGGADSLSAYADCFVPYVSPNAAEIDPEYAPSDGAWTPFSLVPIVLIYNPKLVRQNLPTGWESLLDASWRGRIAFADPAVSGSSYTALCTLLQVLGGDEETTLAAFYRNLGGRLISDSGDVVTAVADGSCYIGVTLEENACKAIDEGLDVAIVYPTEGTSILPDGAAIVRDCAHEENARRFLDFLLLPETQEALASELGRRSVRADDVSALPEITAVPYDLDRALRERQSLLEAWRTLSGEGEA